MERSFILHGVKVELLGREPENTAAIFSVRLVSKTGETTELTDTVPN